MTPTLTLVMGLLTAAGFVLATALVAAASELRAVLRDRLRAALATLARYGWGRDER